MGFKTMSQFWNIFCPDNRPFTNLRMTMRKITYNKKREARKELNPQHLNHGTSRTCNQVMRKYFDKVNNAEYKDSREPSSLLWLSTTAMWTDRRTWRANNVNTHETGTSWGKNWLRERGHSSKGFFANTISFESIKKTRLNGHLEQERDGARLRLATLVLQHSSNMLLFHPLYQGWKAHKV